MLKLIATAAIGLGFALTAMAAETPDPNSTLREMAGRVSVSTGKDFAPAKTDLRLKPGDQVKTQAESSATIIFDDNCRVDIEANKLFKVAEQSVCACRMLAEQRKAKGEPPAPNSTMRKLEGQVSVNAGNEFAPAKPDMRLKPGDRIMTQVKSGATIVFDDKCRLDIEANKLVTVPEQSVCACGLLVEQGLTPGAVAASNTGIGLLVGGTAIIDIIALDGDEENKDEDTVSP
jgi:hypothetical protein